ncbi:MAG: bifunctional diguanylate cyclase/phosphodiesterase [Solirubrobacterales bacterium]|nr:bifunctional diguanylate cyclase/phosphodiesterase [Solirubrobacterales bacterium]
MRNSDHGAARRPPRTVRPSWDAGSPRFGSLGRGSWLRWVYGILAVCLGIYVVSEVIRNNPSSLPLLDNWGVAAFELLASLLCLGRAFVGSRVRLLPLLLGLGLLSWSTGDLILAAESAGGATPPSPSLADVFYLGFYPLTYAGVFLLARRQITRVNATTWLDGAVAGLGAAAVCAEFSLRSISSLSGSPASVAVNLAYPIGDLVLLALVVAGSTVLPGRRKARWLLLAAGYGLNAVGDTFNLFQASAGATHVGTVFNAVAWPTSILLVSLSVWLPVERPDPKAREALPGLVVPGIATFGALIILALSSFVNVDRTAFALAAVTLVIAAARSGLSFVRLRELTDERHGQAVTDQLTTLGNRRALFELLDGLLADHQRRQGEGRKLAFLFIDLNRFKEVNDSFGHSVGDELLRQLGSRLKGLLRSTDLLVRLGGDEFAACLTDADADYGATVARRIGARLEEPFLLGEVKARISASIGIAVVPADARNAHDLLRCADLAMYRAKVEGKAFAIYQEELDGHANRLGLVEELRTAIEERQLDLHYQPQVDLTTGEVVAVEALVRWLHPRLGYVPPLEFLPLAEDAELMDSLTLLVLDKALTQCGIWRADKERMTMSINISTSNLLNPAFPRQVQKLLHDHGLPPEALVLEITETTAMEQIDQCKRVIQELRDLGVGVSVDDFGAGFTSLAYLGSLAVNELKLDRSFINGLAATEGSRDLTLIRSTINLAHALGLRVVAEGVEEQTWLDLLSSFGCDFAQGYLISKPKPAGQVSFQREPAHSPRPHPASERSAADRTPGSPDRGGQWTYGPLPSTGSA